MGFRAYFSVVQNYDVEMWKYAVSLKKSVDDPRSHVHIPNSSRRIMGASVSINSKGLRDREYSYEKSEGTFRILVLGDSVTFGFGVEMERTYPKLLEKWLNESGKRNYEVINAGVGNYNTLQELSAYELDLFRYRPDMIVLGFYLNDAEKTQKYVENFLSKRSISYAFIVSAWRKIAAVMNPNLRYGEYYSLLYS